MSSALQTTETNPQHPAVLDLPANGAKPKLGELLPWLPCTLALDVPVPKFAVRRLLALAPGTLVVTGCHQSSDIPLRVNGLLMAWTEFEVLGEKLAARITDLV